MDAIALQMAVAAAKERGVASRWLPLSGDDAGDAMIALHKVRYKDPPVVFQATMPGREEPPGTPKPAPRCA